MALEVIWGNVKNEMAAQELANTLRASGVDGTLYLGYPVMAAADSSTTVQALLISETPGLVAFDFPEDPVDYDRIKCKQDSLAYAVEGNLSKHETLRQGRRLGIVANIVSFFPDESNVPEHSEDPNYLLAYPGNLHDQLAKCQSVSRDLYRNLSAAIQRVITIKPVKKRDNVKKSDSRGAILKIIEKHIANLDQWQKKAAIETPNGPQRVRGLAGSGKTIVLALKAAYLHSEHPDWTIVVTFQTRSLHQQFIDLVERFTMEHSGDKPDPKKLKILHAWGGFSSMGVYSEIAQALNVAPFDFGAAKQKYGMQNAFNGACSELLPYAKNSSVELYDAILIDEAQDLPASFFQLIYRVTKDPKRIVWAYDELQNLNNTAMGSVSQLFNSEVTISNPENAPQQDIILPVCYRNTPWALTLAHALGFGIYREAGLVQLFDELDLWREIGYQVDEGVLDFEKKVTLSRKAGTFPQFFNELIIRDDAVIVEKFDNAVDQYEWVAQQISKNVYEDELDLDDILIILPDARTSKSQFAQLYSSLQRHNITCHLAGISSSTDVFYLSDSVAVSSIYRAKGNEAPMVYLVNANCCYQGYEMITLRNILFTAITRSRAWIRITGFGDNMTSLVNEIQCVKNNNYKLKFTIPSKEKLNEIRIVNRDRTPEEKEEIRKAEKEAKNILELINKGTMSFENSTILRELVAKISKSNDVDGE